MKILDSKPSFHHCPALNSGFDTSLIPWPGLKFACVKVLQLYGKVFDQTELCELVIRYVKIKIPYLPTYVLIKLPSTYFNGWLPAT